MRANGGPAAPAQNGKRAAQIQRAAADLFFTHGYESTTIREIAEALDIRSATLYYHYENKEQILFELISSTMGQLTSGARELIAEEELPEARLAGLVVQHLVMHALRPRETTLGDTELRSLTGERLREALALRDVYTALVIETVEEGIERGTFDTPDPKLAAFAIIAKCSHVGIWYDPAGRLALPEIASVYGTFALRLVDAPPVDATKFAALTERAMAFHEVPQDNRRF